MQSMFVPVIFSLIIVLLRRFPIDYNPIEGFSFSDKQTSRRNLFVNASASDVFEISTRLGSDQLLDFT
jgi:hypothetical protein